MKNSMEGSADRTKKKIIESHKPSVNGINSVKKDNVPALNLQDKFTIRVAFPEGASCYRTILQKVIRSADTVHQPRQLFLSFESKEKADQQLQMINNLTMNNMPLVAKYEGQSEKANIPAHDTRNLKRKLALNHHYNIEIVRKFFNVEVEQQYDHLTPTKVFYLTFPTAAAASAAEKKQYDFYGEKVKLVRMKRNVNKDLKRHNRIRQRAVAKLEAQKSNAAKPENQKTNTVNDEKQTKEIEVINGEDKTDIESSAKTDAEVTENISQNGGREKNDGREVSDDNVVDRKDKDDDDDNDVIIEEEVAATPEEVKEQKQTKQTEIVNSEVARTDSDPALEAPNIKSVERNDKNGKVVAVESEGTTAIVEEEGAGITVEEKSTAVTVEEAAAVTVEEAVGATVEEKSAAVIVEEEAAGVPVGEEAAAVIIEEEVTIVSEEIKEKRPAKKKTKKTVKTKTDEGATKTDENPQSDEKTVKNSKDANQRTSDIMGDIIEDIKSGEILKQEISVEEEVD